MLKKKEIAGKHIYDGLITELSKRRARWPKVLGKLQNIGLFLVEAINE